MRTPALVQLHGTTLWNHRDVSRRHRRRSRRKRKSLRGIILLYAGLVLFVLVDLVVTWVGEHRLSGALAIAALTFLAVIWFAMRLWSKRRNKATLLARARSLDELLSISPSEFEHTVAALFDSLGYSEVHVTGGSGDLSADIICRDPKGSKTVIQCKQYATNRRVGTPELQMFIGMAYTHHRAAKAIYVTTAEYTRAASELAQKHDIELINGTELATLGQTTNIGR